jgi:hypothetical protein
MNRIVVRRIQQSRVPSAEIAQAHDERGMIGIVRRVLVYNRIVAG